MFSIKKLLIYILFVISGQCKLFTRVLKTYVYYFNIYILVTISKSIHSHSTVTPTNVNSKSVLSCSKEGKQTEWRRHDGQPLPHSAFYKNGNLIIDSRQKEANGLYDCVVTDESGNTPVTIAQASIDYKLPVRVHNQNRNRVKQQ